MSIYSWCHVLLWKPVADIFALVCFRFIWLLRIWNSFQLLLQSVHFSVSAYQVLIQTIYQLLLIFSERFYLSNGTFALVDVKTKKQIVNLLVTLWHVEKLIHIVIKHLQWSCAWQMLQSQFHLLYPLPLLALPYTGWHCLELHSCRWK